MVAIAEGPANAADDLHALFVADLPAADRAAAIVRVEGLADPWRNLRLAEDPGS